MRDADSGRQGGTQGGDVGSVAARDQIRREALRLLDQLGDSGTCREGRHAKAIRVPGDDVERFIESCRIQPGQLVLLEALGGGLTWGSALMRM